MAAAVLDPSPERLAWVASALARPLAELRWRALPAREGPTALWTIDAAAGPGWILKEHRRGRGLAQEAEAYRAWGRAGLGRWLTEVVAVAPGAPGAILLERLPGRPIAGDGEPDEHRRAGEFLAALRRVALADDDPLPPAEALRRRVEATIERARGRVDARARGRLAERAAALAGVRLGPRGLAHRDFGPWNWLTGDEHHLWVIDLEHARPDLPLVDLARLALGPWRRRPALADAFFAGYGRALDADEEALLEVLVLLHALGTRAWATPGRPAALEVDADELLSGLT